MKNNLETVWSGFSASIIGSGHINRGLPCQDASAVVTSHRPALIFCDGRGSASRSQDGANGAVRDFITQCAVFEPFLASVLDVQDVDAGRWEMFCRILYRTLMQTKLNLSAEHNVPEKEFDFTVAAAVVGTNWIGCFQVGDGSIVLRQNGTAQTAFLPDKGEFANQTVFLRQNGEAKGSFHAKLFSAHENSGIAITSDGPEHIMFHLADMTPGKVFHTLFDDMQNRSLTKQDIMDYLTRREWANDPRGQDDRSIAILAPELRQKDTERRQEIAHDVNRPGTNKRKQDPSKKTIPVRDHGNQAPASAPEPCAAAYHEPADVTKRNIGTEGASRVVQDTHNWFASGGVAYSAILILLLAMMYYQLELSSIRQELNQLYDHLNEDIHQTGQSAVCVEADRGRGDELSVDNDTPADEFGADDHVGSFPEKNEVIEPDRGFNMVQAGKEPFNGILVEYQFFSRK